MLILYEWNELSEWIAQVTHDKWVTMSDLLTSLRENERLWANRSLCSEGMSDCDQIAQVAHQKWADEQIAHFFEQIAHFAQREWVIVSKLLRSLIKNEQITQVAHQKRANEQITCFFEWIAHSLIIR